MKGWARLVIVIVISAALVPTHLGVQAAPLERKNGPYGIPSGTLVHTYGEQYERVLGRNPEWTRTKRVAFFTGIVGGYDYSFRLYCFKFCTGQVSTVGKKVVCNGRWFWGYLDPDSMTRVR